MRRDGNHSLGYIYMDIGRVGKGGQFQSINPTLLGGEMSALKETLQTPLSDLLFNAYSCKIPSGVDADSGLMHTLLGTSGNEHDLIESNSVRYGEESRAFGDTAYQGVDTRPDGKAKVSWHVAMGPGKGWAQDGNNASNAAIDKAERLKAGTRAKVELPFQMLKRHFGYVQVRLQIEKRGCKASVQPNWVAKEAVFRQRLCWNTAI